MQSIKNNPVRTRVLLKQAMTIIALSCQITFSAASAYANTAGPETKTAIGAAIGTLTKTSRPMQSMLIEFLKTDEGLMRTTEVVAALHSTFLDLDLVAQLEQIFLMRVNEVSTSPAHSLHLKIAISELAAALLDNPQVTGKVTSSTLIRIANTDEASRKTVQSAQTLLRERGIATGTSPRIEAMRMILRDSSPQEIAQRLSYAKNLLHHGMLKQPQVGQLLASLEGLNSPLAAIGTLEILAQLPLSQGDIVSILKAY